MGRIRSGGPCVYLGPKAKLMQGVPACVLFRSHVRRAASACVSAWLSELSVILCCCSTLPRPRLGQHQGSMRGCSCSGSASRRHGHALLPTKVTPPPTILTLYNSRSSFSTSMDYAYGETHKRLERLSCDCPGAARFELTLALPLSATLASSRSRP